MNRCTIGCFARRRACSPSLASWWLEGSEPWSLGRGQVAVLRLHAASLCWPRDEGIILPLEGQAYHSNGLSLVLLGRCLRITNFGNSFMANFREIPECELRLNGVLRSSDIGSCVAPVQHPRVPLAVLGFLRVLSDLSWLPYNTHRTRPVANSVTIGMGQGALQSDAPAAHEGAQRWPWWHRVFGG